MTLRFSKPAVSGVLAILLATGSAFSAPPLPIPDEDALKLDESIQALKEEALDIKARQQIAENDLLYPETTRTTVYLGVKAAALLVKSVAVSIDEGAPERIMFDQDGSDNDQSIALQVRGLLTVMRANAAPGVHRLRAEVVSHYNESGPKVEPYVTSFESQFDKDELPAELELSLDRDFNGRPVLSLHEWRAAK